MKIAISGASGYIGQQLTLFFTEKGDEVVPLGRNLFKEENFDELCHRVESCDVVINLRVLPLISAGQKRISKNYMIVESGQPISW